MRYYETNIGGAVIRFAEPAHIDNVILYDDGSATTSLYNVEIVWPAAFKSEEEVLEATKEWLKSKEIDML